MDGHLVSRELFGGLPFSSGSSIYQIPVLSRFLSVNSGCGACAFVRATADWCAGCGGLWVRRCQPVAASMAASRVVWGGVVVAGLGEVSALM